ncbi:hypothetical protein BC831DRAFT_439810 [Entophlyctis helioformis]|nr:hypothetical protein BC831DRAFT_439810 [Entophlyctis helioformis]
MRCKACAAICVAMCTIHTRRSGCASSMLRLQAEQAAIRSAAWDPCSQSSRSCLHQRMHWLAKRRLRVARSPAWPPTLFAAGSSTWPSTASIVSRPAVPRHRPASLICLSGRLCASSAASPAQMHAAPTRSRQTCWSSWRSTTRRAPRQWSDAYRPRKPARPWTHLTASFYSACSTRLWRMAIQTASVAQMPTVLLTPRAASLLNGTRLLNPKHPRLLHPCTTSPYSFARSKQP